MECFWSRYGVLTKANCEALLLEFYFDEKIQEAIAIKDVCYIHDLTVSQDPSRDFKVGERLNFSAVKDSRSVLPDKWKVITAWTHRKPIICYSLSDWDNNVDNLYEENKHYLYDLCNIVGSNKNLKLEQASMLHILRVLEDNFERVNLYCKCDSTFEEAMMMSTTPQVKNYIHNQYKSWSKFIEYHSKIFIVSLQNMICPLYDSKSVDLQLYLKETLPQLLEDWNTVPKNTLMPALKKCKSADELMLNLKNIFKRHIRIVKIEQFLILYLLREIKLGLSKERLYSVNDTSIDILMSQVPGLVKGYVIAVYSSLKEFLKFHPEVFSISGSKRLYPKRKFSDSYVNEQLPIKINNFNLKFHQQKSDLLSEARLYKIMQCFNLEQKAILHFVHVLQTGNTGHSTLLSTEPLEVLFNESPKPIKDTIKAHHSNMINFIDFHYLVFHISSALRIYPRSITRVKKYILCELAEMFIGCKLEPDFLMLEDRRGDYYISTSSNQRKGNSSITFATCQSPELAESDEEQNVPIPVKENYTSKNSLWQQNNYSDILSESNEFIERSSNSSTPIQYQCDADFSDNSGCIYFSDDEFAAGNDFKNLSDDEIYHSDEETEGKISNNYTFEMVSSPGVDIIEQETPKWLTTKDVYVQTLSTGPIKIEQVFYDEEVA